MNRGGTIFHQRLTAAAALVAGLLWAPPTLSAEPDAPVVAPWITAADVARDTETDIKKSDVPGIKGHLEALEKALDEGAKAFPPPPAPDGTITILADGAAEAKAVRAAKKPNMVVADNPYPRIGYYLGTYYNNEGRPYEALRVVELGLKLTSDQRNLGAQRPNLYNELGFSLEILKRWPDAIQICKTGLDLPAAERLDRARFYRCMGFSFNELGRFDEAATAYRAAIRLDPDDKIAPIKLDFILHHRTQ